MFNKLLIMLFSETASLLSFMKTLEGGNAVLPSPIKTSAGPSSTSSPKGQKSGESKIRDESKAAASTTEIKKPAQSTQMGSQNGDIPADPITPHDEEMPEPEAKDAPK